MSERYRPDAAVRELLPFHARVHERLFSDSRNASVNYLLPDC
jgi:hypothetical protein